VNATPIPAFLHFQSAKMEEGDMPVQAHLMVEKVIE